MRNEGGDGHIRRGLHCIQRGSLPHVSGSFLLALLLVKVLAPALAHLLVVLFVGLLDCASKAATSGPWL